MNLEDALYHAVHDYPGGAEPLAIRMGIAPSTLQSMANPRLETHQWTLKRIRQVIDFTRDVRPVHAFCEENGGVFVPTTRNLDTPLPELFRAVHNCARELGDVTREIDEALKDGKISENEGKRVHQQLFEMIQAACELGRRIDLEAQPAQLKAVK